jgi:hypothetical protein
MPVTQPYLQATKSSFPKYFKGLMYYLILHLRALRCLQHASRHPGDCPVPVHRARQLAAQHCQLCSDSTVLDGPEVVVKRESKSHTH